MKNKRCSSILNEVKINDLLNIDQTDSCVTHISYNNILKGQYFYYCDIDLLFPNLNSVLLSKVNK